MKKLKPLLYLSVIVASSLLIYYKGCSESFIKKDFKVEMPSSNGNPNFNFYKSGVNTFRYDFSNSKLNSPIVLKSNYKQGQGLVLEEDGHFSPVIEFRVRDLCKDSIIYIYTQALLCKLSKKNMNVVYVVSLEEHGNERTKWFGCFALNENFPTDKWEILNGKHKLEDYIITDSTYLKAYIWNKGSGDIAIDHIELILVKPVDILGKKTLIATEKQKALPEESGFRYFNDPSKLEGELVTGFSDKTFINGITFQNHTIYLSGNKNILSYDLVTKKSTVVLAGIPVTRPIVSIQKGKVYTTSQKIKGGSITIFTTDTSANAKNQYSIKLAGSNQYIGTADLFENNENIFQYLSLDAKSGFQIENGKQIIPLIIKLKSDSMNRISNLTQLNTTKLLITSSTTTGPKNYIGSYLKNTLIVSPLQYSSDIDEKQLSIDDHSTFIPLGNEDYLLLSTSWRNSLYAVHISAENKITVLKNFRLTLKDSKLSPLYFEHIEICKGSYNNTNGFYLYCFNDSETPNDTFGNSNRQLFFYKFD